MIDTQGIRERWNAVGCKLDERGRRVFASGEVRATGWGGLKAVSQITGLARSTINRGLKDLDAAPLPKGRVRRKDGGPPSGQPGRDVGRGSAAYRRASHARVPGPSALMGVEEPRQAGRRPAEVGPQDQREQRAQAVADARLQPAIEPQGAGGLEASRP